MRIRRASRRVSRRAFRHLAAVLGFSLVLVPAGLAARAEMKDVAHPYILWTKDDVGAIKDKAATEAWLKEKLAALPNNTFGNLFKYQVLGDQKAGKAERDYLLDFAKKAPVGGGSDENGNNTSQHYDNYLAALRYDALYDSLSPEQRQQVEAKFRQFIQYELDHPYRNTRLSLLPNMQLPRLCAALMMSVALKDEKTIRELWAAPSSFRWFFEDYLSDSQFYNEEFAKMTSLIGEFELYARGLDRLGLSELGWDFKGKNGGSLRRYIDSFISLGYPRTDLPGGMPAYTRIAMGDARGGALLQHFLVPGFLPGQSAEDAPAKGKARGPGGWSLWYAANMNGRDHKGAKVEKLNFPHWFEILAARFADSSGPERYFLAQMRAPGQEKYYPTPFWGLDPIDPSQVQPPPAPSYVASERGFAFLRANETPAYWSSPDPAVALQFAQLYVHYTADCFSLLGYYQFNRPIYVNRSISAGYNGGPWDFSVRGHCGVVVDNQQAQPIGVVPSRSEFAPVVKFVSARGIALQGLKGRGEVRSSDQPHEAASEVYSNTELSRSLFLTKEYLFDAYKLADKSGTPRDFYWLVHAPGSAVDQGADWQDDDSLQKSLFHTPWQNPTKDRASLPPEKRLYEAPTTGTQGPDWLVIQNAKRFAAGDKPLAITTLQDYRGADVKASTFGPEWYARKIGVRVSMLPAGDTTAYTFDTPTSYAPGSPRSADSKDSRVMSPEYGGVSIAVHRRAPTTVFAALHEPYENGTPNQTAFTPLQQTDEGLAVSVRGKTAKGVAYDDRILLAFDKRPEAAVKESPDFEKDAKPLTLGGGGEFVTFAGHGFVRITPEAVEVSGPVQAVQVKVSGTPKLVVNGKEMTATVSDGMMRWGK